MKYGEPKVGDTLVFSDDVELLRSDSIPTYNAGMKTTITKKLGGDVVLVKDKEEKRKWFC
jgi:hypothetical protein